MIRKKNGLAQKNKFFQRRKIMSFQKLTYGGNSCNNYVYFSFNGYCFDIEEITKKLIEQEKDRDEDEEKAEEIASRIRELRQLENELRRLQHLGATFPTDDVEGKDCVCHLVKQKAQ